MRGSGLIKPAPPFIMMSRSDVGSIRYQPYLGLSSRHDVQLLADPRFAYGYDTCQRLVKTMKEFLNRPVSFAKDGRIQEALHGVIMSGYNRGDVFRPTADHPGAYPPHWPHNCEDCIYLGMGAPKDGVPIDLYFCEHSMLGSVLVLRHGEAPEDFSSFPPEARDRGANVWLACLLAEEEYLL